MSNYSSLNLAPEGLRLLVYLMACQSDRKKIGPEFYAPLLQLFLDDRRALVFFVFGLYRDQFSEDELSISSVQKSPPASTETGAKAVLLNYCEAFRRK